MHYANSCFLVTGYQKGDVDEAEILQMQLN